MNNEIITVTRIGELIAQGIECWLEAGKILVDVLENGETLDSISSQIGISKDMLTMFERIGHESLHPKLLVSTSTGANKLKNCGYSEQKRYSDEPVNVLVMKGEKVESINIGIDSLTADQCKQVFGHGHVRDDAGQRAFLESKFESERMTKVKSIEDGTGYVLSGSKVTFKKNVTMDKNDLIAILGRLK
jgi:hypothetical protein